MKTVTVYLIIELFFKISISLAMAIIVLYHVLPILPVSTFSCLSTLIATLLLCGLYGFSEIKTLTQKLE
jgi:hypothetical protein